MEEGSFDVDWEFEYEAAKKDTKNMLKIPLKEKVKIIRKKLQKIKEMKSASEIEAVNKYCEKEDREKCLKILKDIREGRINIKERDIFREGKENNDPLFKAIIKAINENDCPCVMTLSRGCFIPNVPINIEQMKLSLFEYACKVFSDECALFLLGRGPKSLIMALTAGNEGIAMYLIEEGADIEVIPLLHMASMGNCLEIAKMLIEKGADIEEKESNGFTPLYLAAIANSIEVTKLLVEKGADIEFKDCNGRTIREMVVDSEVIAILEEAKMRRKKVEEINI